MPGSSAFPDHETSGFRERLIDKHPQGLDSVEHALGTPLQSTPALHLGTLRPEHLTSWTVRSLDRTGALNVPHGCICWVLPGRAAPAEASPPGHQVPAFWASLFFLDLRKGMFWLSVYHPGWLHITKYS